MWLVPALFCLHAATECAEFDAPGYDTEVCGAWYAPGEAADGMPLGALGTGFVDLLPSGAFGNHVTQNNWLEPRPVARGSGFVVEAGGKTADLRRGAPPVERLRFWGHYPAADLDFRDALAPVTVHMRAFAPLIPHDYERSNLPAALFRFAFENTSSAEQPVRVRFHWAAGGANDYAAEGNTEGALGWTRDELASGATWTCAPVLAFAKNAEVLRQRLQSDAFAGSGPALQAAPAPEGAAYAFGEVETFLLDAWGGFNWETRRRESAVFAGAPNIGQLFWQLQYDGGAAGRMKNGPQGFAPAAGLPAQTKDGQLAVALEVRKAGPNAVALYYRITNLADTPVKNLRFGMAVNFDVGGPAEAEHQRAQYQEDLRAIVFEQKGDGAPAAALSGDAGHVAVKTWPNAHRAMANNKLAPAQRDDNGETGKRFAGGMELACAGGTYAIAGAGDGWTPAATETETEQIAVAFAKTLPAGARGEVTFALGWHFPQWVSTDNEHVTNRYTTLVDSARCAAQTALAQATRIERDLIAWQSRVYAANVPPLLKDAVLNGLYVLPRNSLWLGDGRFFQSESFTGCAITETVVCRFNGAFPLALMWPECEKASIRALAAAQSEEGEIPFAFGRGASTRSPYYKVQHPIVSTEFILMAWRDYQLWGDEAWRREMYPHVLEALRFAETLDKDGNGLINEDPGSETGFPANQYYDIWPWWGESAYTGSICLAALAAAEQFAEKAEEPCPLPVAEWRAKATRAFEDRLWTGEYYRLYHAPAMDRRSDTSLTNQLCGQWFAYTCGLPRIVPEAHIDSVIDTVLRLNAPATPYGAVNGVKPGGAPDRSFPGHSAVTTIGEVWNFCAMAAFAGRKDDAIALFNESYGNILLKQRTPWNITWSIDPDTGKLKWGINYYSNPCVWTLFQALAPEAYAGMQKPAS